MNAAVRSVVRTSLARGCIPYVIFEGWQGVVDGGDKVKRVGWEDVRGIMSLVSCLALLILCFVSHVILLYREERSLALRAVSSSGKGKAGRKPLTTWSLPESTLSWSVEAMVHSPAPIFCGQNGRVTSRTCSRTAKSPPLRQNP